MIRLRPAEPQDSWLFYQLRRQIQPDLLLADHDAWWQDVWEHRFVAYDGPVMVGIIRISPLVETMSRVTSEIDALKYAATLGLIHLLVTEKERGKGLGTAMLSSIKRVARELGFTRLEAYVAAENISSQRAFLAAGYRPIQFEVELC